MSFSFSFSGDDIEADDDDSVEEIAEKLQDASLEQRSLLAVPQLHALKDLLISLPSQISYNAISTSDDSHAGGAKTQVILRRSLFDIRQQLMVEADPTQTHDETHDLLNGLDTGDLNSGIYEGGFKTWECALDLAKFVAKQDHLANASIEGKDLHVIELGAGSAIPSLALISRFIQLPKQHRRVVFTICDYNEPVLRLCTTANVLLTVLLASGSIPPSALTQGDDQELDVTPEVINSCICVLEEACITVNLISGSWSANFVDLVRKQESSSRSQHYLVLASETIYDTDNLDIFAQTVLDLITTKGSCNSTAYIAAKKMYFGVGGGVREFEDSLRRVGGLLRPCEDVEGVGVGRGIWEASVNSEV